MRAFLAAVDAFETAASARTGIVREHLRIAETMLATPEVSADQIARALGLAPSAVSEALDALHSAGKVKRSADHDDGFSLTDQTRAELTALYQPLRDAQATLHAYRADELRTVRRFVRTGRELYAEQLRRLTSG